jgi:plasmid stabilization system protein ParE
MKSKPVEYLPGALLDLRESITWYEAQESGVGDRFYAAVQLTEQNILKNPLFGMLHRRNTRKRRVRRFPHGVIYRDESERVLIVAIAHPKRQEGYLGAPS